MPYKTRKIVLHEKSVKLVEEKNSKNIDLLAFVAKQCVASKKLHHFLDFRSCCAYEHVHVQHQGHRNSIISGEAPKKKNTRHIFFLSI